MIDRVAGAAEIAETRKVMELPSIREHGTLTHLLLGALAGSLATMVIGFAWGGWTLEGTAQRMADKKAAVAVMAVLAPMCAEKFREDVDVTANMTDAYIEKGGWATFPGIVSPFGVDHACATALQ
jgi:hypothetical protein